MSMPLTKPSPCFLAWHSGHTTVGLSWGLPSPICLLVSTRAPDSQWFSVRPPPLALPSSPPCSAHLPPVLADPAQPPHPPRPHPVVGDNLSDSQSLGALRSCFVGSTAFQVDFVLHLLMSFWEGVIYVSSPITSWQIDGEKNGNSDRLYCLGSKITVKKQTKQNQNKITVDTDCSHEIRRH